MLLNSLDIKFIIIVNHPFGLSCVVLPGPPHKTEHCVHCTRTGMSRTPCNQSCSDWHPHSQAMWQLSSIPNTFWILNGLINRNGTTQQHISFGKMLFQSLAIKSALTIIILFLLNVYLVVLKIYSTCLNSHWDLKNITVPHKLFFFGELYANKYLEHFLSMICDHLRAQLGEMSDYLRTCLLICLSVHLSIEILNGIITLRTVTLM